MGEDNYTITDALVYKSKRKNDEIHKDMFNSVIWLFLAGTVLFITLISIAVHK